MRNFFWNVFAVTGNIDAYLMYKGAEIMDDSGDENGEESVEEEAQ